MTDQEVRRWIKVVRPANGSRMSVTITLLQGSVTSKWSMATSTTSLRRDTKTCYGYAKSGLDDLQAINAVLDDED